MVNCGICDRRVLRHSRTYICCICFVRYHIKCLPLSFNLDNSGINGSNWICVPCNSTIFPFNHIDDNASYLKDIDMFFNHQHFNFKLNFQSI